MAYSFDGTTQYIREAAGAVSAYPLTLAAWIKKTATTAKGTVLGIASSSDSNSWWRVVATSAPAIAMDVYPIYRETVATGSYAAGGWVHVCGVFTSTTSRTCYRDGANAGTGTVASGTPASINRTSIGILDRAATPTEFFDGDIAEAAIWSAALTADEVASLAKNISPRLIRPQSLVRYVPLIRELQELRTRATLTNTNGATAGAAHPRTYR